MTDSMNENNFPKNKSKGKLLDDESSNNSDVKIKNKVKKIEEIYSSIINVCFVCRYLYLVEYL